MQIRIFSLPVIPDALQTEDLNHFLRANKIVDIRKELATIGGNDIWTFCVTYIQGMAKDPILDSLKNGKVDYKEVLDEDVFKIFSDLRKARKSIANEEAVPAYAVFTDVELSEIAKLVEITPNNMRTISGIGKKKIEKYAENLIAKYESLKDETSRIPD